MYYLIYYGEDDKCRRTGEKEKNSEWPYMYIDKSPWLYIVGRNEPPPISSSYDLVVKTWRHSDHKRLIRGSVKIDYQFYSSEFVY